MGPDKWATAWLLTRALDPSTELLVVPQGVTLAEGIPFDVPGSNVRRIGDKASFEIALDRTMLRGNDGAHAPEDLATLARIVHEIEVDFWNQDDSPAAQAVENAFRALQRKHGRDAVTPACYVSFFDRVHAAIRSAREAGNELDRERLAFDCEELAKTDALRTELVPELALPQVLNAIASSKRVVFVDVRESAEFEDGHIPGAINASLRDVSPALLERLHDAEHVISYCVKDFRGFEMAKALAQAGITSSSIMKPYGIKGWVSAGMPTAGQKALPEAAAHARLRECAVQPALCSPSMSGAKP